MPTSTTFRDNETVNKLLLALDLTANLVLQQLPALRDVSLEIVETVFVPSTIAKQLLLLAALETGMVTLSQLTAFLQGTVGYFVSSQARYLRQLQRQQTTAASQDEWMDLAERIDAVQGHDVWRTEPSCALYERHRITARIDEYVHLMRRRDIFELMFVLRGSIGRNKFGLLHEGLFSKAKAGTKVLVETYHNVVCAALDFVCDAAVPPQEHPIPTQARLAFFNETRHAYGRTALLLSGGAALGFYHVGVVKALMENRLLPRVLGGASAGSIVCAMLGTRTDEECMRDLFQVKGSNAPGHSGRIELNFFRPLEIKNKHNKYTADSTTASENATLSSSFTGFAKVYHNTAGAFRDVKRTLQGFVPIPLRRFSATLYHLAAGNTRAKDLFLNDTEHFRNCMRANVGNFTFQEAFDRTGRILNIVVTPQNASDPPRLLNYLTAPHVLVWSAAVASSSLPGVFEANRLVVKEADGWERYESAGDDQAFADGSLEQDLPMQTLSEMFNINHFIISQANPHAVMFASYNQKRSVWTHGIAALMFSIMTFLKSQVRTWLQNLVECLGARRIAPLFETNRLIPTQFFTQEYEGRPSDISLCPWSAHRSLWSALLHIIYNPCEAEFREWIAAAERETWKHVPAVKSHIAEEMTLDRCVQRLRRRLIQESWEKQHGAVEMENTTTGRVPSFFTSPSLTNMGGLSILDRPALVDDAGGDGTTTPVRVNCSTRDSSNNNITSNPQLISAVDVNYGWGGMGLKGNRSSGNLQRTASDASGLFIDDDGVGIGASSVGGASAAAAAAVSTAAATTAELEPASEQSAGEQSDPPMPPEDSSGANSPPHLSPGYIKTTSMAHFYYRKSHGSAGSLGSAPPGIAATVGTASERQLQRQKSKSSVDLGRR